MVRFFLRRLEPDLELYASPVNFDPKAPLYPISEPSEFSGEMADDLGLFYTTGMAEDHAALMNGRIDEHGFLAQCAELWDEREAMLMRTLERTSDGLVYCLFDTPDRVQHLFWRFREPDHPANGGTAPNAEFRDTIAEHYRRADAAVGAALEAVDNQTLFIALSDHGFGSFRRCVELNAWLQQQGLLTLTPGLQPGDADGELLRGIDWEHTRAYAVGLSGIYLNLAGREGRGVVSVDEIESLESGIIQGLTGLVDPGTGLRPVREVRRRADLYAGPCAADSPDLMVHLDRGYRVGWTTGLGGVAAQVFADNTKRWSGDHIFDPALVPGTLFMNRPFATGNCNMRDLAPTILAAFGLRVPTTAEGSSLLP
jgi:predicted AlkP superfamily phosphohydrolase/phosphomutase